MPLYEYVCQDCNHSFETLVLGNETIDCPECQSEKLERQLSVPAAPRTKNATSLPMNCDPGLPPCGPGCCRL